MLPQGTRISNINLTIVNVGVHRVPNINLGECRDPAKISAQLLRSFLSPLFIVRELDTPPNPLLQVNC